MNELVIGGGISGLARAYELVSQGKKVILFESHSLGGVVQTAHSEGFTLELGPEVLVEKPALRALIKNLGLNASVVYPAIQHYKQFVWFNDRVQEVPRSFMALLTSPLISIKNICRLLSKMFSTNGMPSPQQEESVSDFFSRLIGKESVTHLLDPALQGIYGGDSSRLSVQALFPNLYERVAQGGTLFSYIREKAKARRRIFVLREGMQLLVAKLRQEISAHATVIQENVTSVTRNTDNLFSVRVAAGTEFTGSTVHVSTAGRTSAKFLTTLDSQLAAKLQSVRSAALVVVHIAVDSSEALPTDSFGVLFPPRHASGVLGVMFNSLLFPHMAPPGKQLLKVCLGGIFENQICALSDAEITLRVQHTLENLLKLKNFKILLITRWPVAITQYELGHLELLQLMRNAEQRYPGLFFCGADRGGIGVADRIETAWKATTI